MSLNLGIKPTSTEQLPIVDLSDVLSAELEFTEAYQTFLDYRNTCEIIVKAKASEERQAFAQELLGVSVESISISVEKFTTALKRAWEKFVGWIKQAISYIKYAIIKHTFKKDGEFEVKVESRECHKRAAAAAEAIIQKMDKGEDVENDLYNWGNSDIEEETITTRAALVEWLRLFDKTIYVVSCLVKRHSDNPEVMNMLKDILSTKNEWRNDMKQVLSIVKKNKNDIKQSTDNNPKLLT